ncbi:hypothetical protein [Rhodoferax sp.]|uniref:hypothetical protein n=1 Tax=Rhodoferax sp. TaxID=50421 RepID=UPI002ACDBB6F|nr:hypothetical protein [Rhodoferax sp.]MDZ7920488.1 hypothetical protein [Rhodoferax sp.]
MPKSKFPAHGEYKSTIDGQVLIAHCWGSWNIEMHQESARLSKPLVEELNAKGPWGCITVVHESMVTSLEVLQAGRDAVASLPKDSALVALAWVLKPDLEGYSFLYKRYESMYTDLLETKTFDNLSAAQFWIEKVIASKPKGLVA